MREIKKMVSRQETSSVFLALLETKNIPVGTETHMTLKTEPVIPPLPPKRLLFLCSKKIVVLEMNLCLYRFILKTMVFLFWKMREYLFGRHGQSDTTSAPWLLAKPSTRTVLRYYTVHYWTRGADGPTWFSNSNMQTGRWNAMEDADSVHTSQEPS